MRVTNKMIADGFLSDLRLNMQNLKKLNEQLTSGKEIKRPSDDPFKVARSMQLHTDINTNKQYNNNIKDTINWLDETDTALNQVGNQVHRIRELLVSAGNVTYGSSERKKIKDEINEIIGQVAQTLNSSFDGKYLFSGTRVTKKPVKILTGPAVTEVLQPPTTDIKNPPGKGIVTGDFGGVENIDYVIKVNGLGNITVTANGEQVDPAKITTVNNEFKFDNGLKFKVDGNMQKDTEYKFTAVAKGNTKLQFSGKEGEALPEPTMAEVTNISNWKGKKLTFNYAGKDTEIVIDNKKDINDIDKLVSNINENINTTDLKDKLQAVKVEADGKNYVDFVVLEEKADIKISDTEISDVNDLKGKKLSDNQLYMLSDRVITEISQGVKVEYNITVTDVIKFKDKYGKDRDLRDIFENIVRHLDMEDGEEDVKKITNDDLEAIDEVMDNILKLRSQAGAKMNRMESALNKNKAENFDMTDILSKTEDIDFAEKTMEQAVAITVYQAALQTSARVLLPTLMDYLR